MECLLICSFLRILYFYILHSLQFPLVTLNLEMPGLISPEGMEPENVDSLLPYFDSELILDLVRKRN